MEAIRKFLEEAKTIGVQIVDEGELVESASKALDWRVHLAGVVSFQQGSRLRLLRSGPAGPSDDQFSETLFRNGFSPWLCDAIVTSVQFQT